MIDEKKLIEKIKSIRLYFRGLRSGEKMVDEYLKHYRQAILDTIEKQPKVNEWIPVEERLPEESLNSVIGWDACRERCVFAKYYMNDWILGNHEHVKIVAWMPLPEPYERKMKNDRK